MLWETRLPNYSVRIRCNMPTSNTECQENCNVFAIFQCEEFSLSKSQHLLNLLLLNNVWHNSGVMCLLFNVRFSVLLYRKPLKCSFQVSNIWIQSSQGPPDWQTPFIDIYLNTPNKSWCYSWYELKTRCNTLTV